MREIKFRAKRIDNGEWVYGSYIKFAKTHAIGWPKPETGSWLEFDIVPETVGEFTGLKDKNGKEIYEGDIVNWEWDALYDAGEKIRTHKKEHNEVFWCEEMAQFGLRENTNLGHWTFENEDARFEVIGDIHTTPELIR